MGLYRERERERSTFLSFPDLVDKSRYGVALINLGDYEYYLTDLLFSCYEWINGLMTSIKDEVPFKEDFFLSYGNYEIIINSRYFLPYLSNEHNHILCGRGLCFKTFAYTLVPLKNEILKFVNVYLLEKNLFSDYILEKEIEDVVGYNIKVVITFRDVFHRSIELLDHLYQFSTTPESDQKELFSLKAYIIPTPIEREIETLRSYWLGSPESYQQVIEILLAMGYIRRQNGILWWQKSLILLVTLGLILRDKGYISKGDKPKYVGYKSNETFLRILHNTFPHRIYKYKSGNLNTINRVTDIHKNKFEEILKLPDLP